MSKREREREREGKEEGKKRKAKGGTSGLLDLRTPFPLFTSSTTQQQPQESPAAGPSCTDASTRRKGTNRPKKLLLLHLSVSSIVRSTAKKCQTSPFSVCFLVKIHFSVESASQTCATFVWPVFELVRIFYSNHPP